jgi:5S rRNA maturation endonuclease (ribonuclease M5)
MTTTTDNRQEIDDLKRRIGRQPFEARATFNGDFCACPFHVGDSPKSMHLHVGDEGFWLAHCFSDCKQSWDAIAFVMKKDNVDFAEARKRLEGLPPDTRAAKPKRTPVAMTAAQWEKWGRPIEQTDVEKFAASRQHSHTATLEYFRALGVRVKDEYLGFPYRRNGAFSGVKMRKLGTKDFIFANAVDTSSLFNLEALNPLDDAYVVEGEPDVLTMAEYGFAAVSPFSGQQNKFSPAALKSLLEAPRIFVVGDQDAPGAEFAERICKLLPPEKTFRITFTEAKDVGELALKLGVDFANRMIELSGAAATPPTPWVRLNIKPIHKVPKDPKMWIADRFLPYKGLSMASGRQGSMKSYLAFLGGQSISGGRPDFLGRAIGVPMDASGGENAIGYNALRVPVLYIDRENPAAEINDRRKWLGIIGNNDLLYWGDWDPEPTPEPDDPRLLEFVRRENAFVIFDSMQQWLGEANENATGEMLMLMNKFKRLARQGAGVLLLHHDNKPDRKTDKSQTRGSTAIVAATDMAFKIAKSSEDPNVLQIRADRFRMCGLWEMDVRVSWAGGHCNFEVVRDDDMAAAVQRQKDEAATEQERKRKAKQDEEAPDRARLEQAVNDNPKASVRKLEEITGIRRSRIGRLLAEANWKCVGGEWVPMPAGTAGTGTPEDLLPV